MLRAMALAAAGLFLMAASKGCQPVCGNGVREIREECDDHNTVSGDGCSATCVLEPPPGQSAAQVEAFHLVNAIRAPANLPGLALAPALDTAAQNHATYYSSDSGSCIQSPHVEVQNCPRFTGVNFWDRDAAAGFTGQAFYEVMAFAGDPSFAIPQWLNTPFHRVPILHPNAVAMGYGDGPGVDVIDFGSGQPVGVADVIVYPPPGATGVVGSFWGGEIPAPPAPPGGFPTGPLVSVFVRSGAQVSISSHVIRDAQGNALPHAFLTPDDPTFGIYLAGSYSLYAHGPAPSGATFEVIIQGTDNGNAFTRDWKFSVQ